MRKLLIADASEPFTDGLRAVLKSEFQLQICHDGESALELLLSFRPDVLILNLMLPYKDGLTVLQESSHKPEIILAVTPFLNAYVEQAAASLGIQYLMIMPTVSALRVRLMDMIANTAAPKESLSSQVSVHLHALNFRPHLDGYQQLCVGLPILAQNPNLRLSKELYPAIAQYFQLADSRTVEHSIRKAIHSAWKNRNPLVWEKYFPPRPDGTLPCPSNKTFLCRMAEFLNL